MMAGIFDSAILPKTLIQTNSIWLKLIHFDLNLMMAAILNTVILNSIMLDSDTWVSSSQIHSKTLSLHSDSDSTNSVLTQTHSFWLNLMMEAILNSAMLDSETLFSSLRFTQKHSHSTLTLTQLIQSDSNSFILTQLDDGSHLWFSILHKKTLLIHFD